MSASNVTSNQVMPLNQALSSITDHKGKLVEFKEEEGSPGYYIGEASESDNNKWIYRLSPLGTPMVQVSVEKVSKSQEEAAKETAKAQPQAEKTTKSK